MKQHLKKWWHVHALLVLIALSIAFLAGAFAGESAYKSIFGVKLSPKGQAIYSQLAKGEPEKGGHVTVEVHLTPAQLAQLNASAQAAAAQLHPNVQATPEPKLLYQPLPDNYSSRPSGSKYELLVAHDTESPNAPGIQDLEAIRAWFSNPNAQASANYVDDAQGNTLEMVNPVKWKAWHVAYFNPWAIGVEQVGYATQTHWPLLQVEATARIFAHWATLYGIPIRHGEVNGCTIVKPGIVFHAELGLCGGGHHDPGLHYPIELLIRLTKLYAGVNQHHHHHRHHRRHHRHGLKKCPVRVIQWKLNRRGFAHPKLTVDGIAGSLTKAAYRKAGSAHKLGLRCRVAW